jgi:D-alanyl-D-alanine carboxypeptidase
MSMLFRAAFLAALGAFTAETATAQQPAVRTPPTREALAARIDSVVHADILARGFPSVSIAIARGAEGMLLERAWGLADVASGRKADPSTIYNIGSTAKQFTAALILRLVERGMLALTDTIGRHLAGSRPEWNAITLDQLLNHTSGLEHDVPQVVAESDSVSLEALVALAAQEKPAAPPGTKFLYSNTGYMLLGALVEKMYGKPYAVVLRDEIVRPLGLQSLGACQTLPEARAATGYIRTSFGTSIPRGYVHPSHGTGAGNICATAGDLARWNAALHGGRVVSAESYTAMTTPRGGAAGDYGFGLGIRKAPWGGAVINHDGEDDGYSSHNSWFPAESLSVTLLYNGLPRHEANIGYFVGFIALGGSPPPVRPLQVPQLPVAATPGDGRPAFVGAYDFTVGRTFIVTFEDGKPYMTPPGGSPTPLLLESGMSYRVVGLQPETIITFTVKDGVVTGFTTRSNGRERELRKVK